VSSNQSRVPVIGVVGAIGAGKSSVVQELARRCPAIRIIDADVVGHAVLEEPEVKQRLGHLFGNIFLPDGRVDRKKLAQLVFGPTEKHQKALRQLESIVHPVMGCRLKEIIERYRSDQSTEAVLLDAAVLFEAGWNKFCDAVVFVDAPTSQRMARIVNSRGWSVEEFKNRELSQLSLEQKKGRADFIVLNADGEKDKAVEELRKFLTQLKSSTFQASKRKK